jgi:SPP1 family predicted phage head-tail adaptor
MPLVITGRRAPRPEIDAGELDRRVTLLAPVYNASQDEIVDWTPMADVWAAVLPGAGQEVDRTAREVGITEIAIVIRYRSDIDGRWRIRDHERLFEINGMTDTARRHVHWSLACQEVL